MSAHRLTKTADRSALETMNDSAYLADAHRGHGAAPTSSSCHTD